MCRLRRNSTREGVLRPGLLTDQNQMSAINLSRLRTQLGLLIPQIQDTAVFIHGLREIYQFYADNTHPVGEPPTGMFTLPAFNTPMILNREILFTLSKYCAEDPGRVLELIDQLWQEPEVELRQLAAQLLGKLPRENENDVIDRIRTWSESSVQPEILPFLHQHASTGIRRTNPERWLDLLNEWESAQKDWLARLAIEGIIPLIDDHNFENLPAIFTFITPFIITPGKDYHIDLVIVIQHLARRSEVETVHFLKKAISLSADPTMARFIRKTLEYFSPARQESLRSALRVRQ